LPLMLLLVAGDDTICFPLALGVPAIFWSLADWLWGVVACFFFFGDDDTFFFLDQLGILSGACVGAAFGLLRDSFGTTVFDGCDVVGAFMMLPNVWYQQCFFYWVMVLTPHSHNRWRWTRLLNSQHRLCRKKPKSAVWCSPGKIRTVCIFWHANATACGTHISKKRCVCIIYKVQFFVMVKNQMQEDACVYLYS
jgi:hypothetical protein